MVSICVNIDIPPEIPMPCNPSPCGENTICREQNGVGSCTCMQNFYGDPYVQCRPECITSNDCSRTQACFNQKCVDPCIGLCGRNSNCMVINHSPHCSCIAGYTGNAFRECFEIRKLNVFCCF